MYYNRIGQNMAGHLLRKMWHNVPKLQVVLDFCPRDCRRREVSLRLSSLTAEVLVTPHNLPCDIYTLIMSSVLNVRKISFCPGQCKGNCSYSLCTPERMWSKGCIDPHIPNVHTSRTCLISFKRRHLHPQGRRSVPFEQNVGWNLEPVKRQISCPFWQSNRFSQGVHLVAQSPSIPQYVCFLIQRHS
jgi:hypothetical protein